MNYGYEPTEHDDKLEIELWNFIRTLPKDKHGMKCYIERDGLYYGVRIRRITHYTNEQVDAIVAGADEIHKKITESQKIGFAI